MKQKCLAETGYERRASFGRRVTLLLGSSLALLSTPAAAEESPEPVIERVRYDARATGDWFGLRSELASVGIDIFAKYDFITSAVIGPTEDTGFTGDLFFGLALSLEQAVGWEGASLAVTGLNRHGNSVDASVQGLYSVQQNFGGQHTFLYNLTFEQKLFEGRLSLKLGRMTATDDFAGSPLFSRYLNNSINGQIRAVLFDGVMTSYPFAVWGARARVDWSEQVYTMVGTFQLSARMWDRELQGADFSVRGGDGASVFSQVGWTPTLGPRRLRGHYYVGANSAFFDMPRFDGDGSDGFLLRTYAHLSQEVFRESEDSDDGLTLFANLAYSPHEQLALVPLQISAGAGRACRRCRPRRGAGSARWRRLRGPSPTRG